MATYEIIKRQRNIDPDPVFFVNQTFATGSVIEHGPYKNEKNAKGRIRDLKAKEVHGNLIRSLTPYGTHNSVTITPTPVPAAVLARDESGPRLPQMIAQRNAQLHNERTIAHQIGCYPAIPKHAYQR